MKLDRKLFYHFLEVGVDESSLGVLIQKLKELDRASFLKQVVGYTWWRRVLKYINFNGYK